MTLKGTFGQGFLPSKGERTVLRMDHSNCANLGPGPRGPAGEGGSEAHIGIPYRDT